jgi:hypothetical protein
MTADDARTDIVTAREELVAAHRELSAVRRENGKDNGYIPSSNSYDRMLQIMEKEGLIDRTKGFDIKKSGTELYINGVAQPNRIYYEYRPYLGAENISINGDQYKITIELRK